jgi:hypothetical protein
MPDTIEPAATGRSKCRACNQPIEKGALRFGERVPNAFGEGEATQWFHVACAAERRPDKLLPALQASGETVADRASLEAIAAEGANNPKLAMVRRAERAPTGRASCQECRDKIAKDALRVAFEREAGEMPAMSAVSFVHARCAPAHFGGDGLSSKLRRTSSQLSAEDLAELEREIAGGVS